MTNQSFHDRLRQLIQEYGEGEQKKLAERLGLDKSLPGTWLKRNSLPSGDSLVAFRERLGISADWLLYGVGNKQVAQPGQVAEPKAIYGRKIDHMTSREREYTEKLLTIFRNKKESTISAITQNIDTFLEVPDAQKKIDVA